MAHNYVNPLIPEAPIVSLRAGVGGKPITYTKGGEYASGSITFANNPTAADTITLNGIYVEFTSSSSDETAAGTEADPVLVNIKASLALTLDELVIVTNAAAHDELIVATYSEDGTDTFNITYDTLTADGNDYTLAASADTVSAATLTGGQAAVAISLNSENITIALTDTNHQYFTLADGVPFQKKTIAMSAKGTGNAVITPSNFTDGSTITLDTARDYVVLQFIVDKWKVVGTSVATIA